MERVSLPAKNLIKIISSTPLAGLDVVLDFSKVRITTEVSDAVLHHFRNAGLLAYRFFRWSSGAPRFSHSIHSHHSVIVSLAKIRQYGLMWGLVHSMKSKDLLNVETFCIIMKQFARANKPDLAIRCFYDMPKFGLPQNLGAFNGLLSALCKSNNVVKAQAVFDSFKDERLFVPDPKCYSILIEGWGRLPNLPKARAVFKEMVDSGVYPDIVTYGIMVDVLCKSGNVLEALGIVRNMELSGCGPTPYVFSALIHTYGMIGRVKDAVEVFKEMEGKGVKPDVVAYNALIGVFVRAGKMNNAYMVLKDMEQRQVQPNSRTCNVLIRGLIGRGETDEAFSMFRRMNMLCDPGTDAYTMIIKMFCVKGDLDMGLKLWKYMKGKCSVPSRHTYAVLVNGLIAKCDSDKACVLTEEMIDNGVYPPPKVLRGLSHLLITQGREDSMKLLKRKLKHLAKDPLHD